jgi:sugar lactone lactonase YvrE
VDGQGNLYFATVGGDAILRFSGGVVECLPSASSSFSAVGIAADNSGVYFSRSGSNVVCKITPSGALVVVAGSNPNACIPNGPSGTPGCTGAEITTPLGLALDTAGKLYIADPGCHTIWKVTSSGTIAVAGVPGNCCYNGDGPATSSLLSQPQGVAVDPSGSIYIADFASGLIRKVTSGMMTTIAGTIAGGVPGECQLATKTTLNAPSSIAVGSGGTIYIGEAGGNPAGYRIARLASTGCTMLHLSASPSHLPSQGGTAKLIAEITNLSGTPEMA